MRTYNDKSYVYWYTTDDNKRVYYTIDRYKLEEYLDEGYRPKYMGHGNYLFIIYNY